MSQTQEYRYFLESLASEATKKAYAYNLKQFCKHINVDDCIRLLNIHPSLAEAQIIDYIVHLKSQGASFSRINVSLAAILHFYTMNDITLNRRKISRFLGKQSMKVERGKSYSKEQIAKILTVCDERTRAIVLLLASTGIRVGAIPELKRKHFTPLANDVSMISVYDGEYFTFCTPEATKAIHEYMQYRERCGEKLGPHSPIIREQFDRDNLLKVRNPNPVPLLTIRTILYDTLNKAGVAQREHLVEGQRQGKSRKEIPLAHGFRRFFNTALMNADVHPSFKSLLMGHSVQLDEVYYDKGSEKSKAKLLDEFSKGIDYLTINEENRLRKKVEVLKAERDEIEMLKGRVQQKDDRVSVLEKQMQSLVSTLSKLTEQGQVNTIAQTLYSSGILKEGITTEKK